MPAGTRKTCKAPVIAHLFYAGCPCCYLTSTVRALVGSVRIAYSKCLSTVHLALPPSVAEIQCTGSISTHGMSLWTHYHVFMDSLLLVFVHSKWDQVLQKPPREEILGISGTRFLGPYAIYVIQPTVSKHWRKSLSGWSVKKERSSPDSVCSSWWQWSTLLRDCFSVQKVKSQGHVAQSYLSARLCL